MSRRRPGFTLLELLLVLALLAAVMALALPSVGMMMADGRIKRAGNQVQIALADARLEAMRSGRTQVFRCQLGTGQYTLTPLHSAADMTEAADMAGQIVPGSAGSAAAASTYTPPEPVAVEISELPDGITFSDQQVESAQRGMLAVQQAAQADRAEQESWTQPIFLYADGTTSTALLKVRSANGATVSVQLRGLTGEAMVSDVGTESEELVGSTP